MWIFLWNKRDRTLDKMKLKLLIAPKPQQRPRSTMIRGRIAVYEDKVMRRWRRDCTHLIKLAYHGEQLEGPLKVKTTFFRSTTKIYH